MNSWIVGTGVWLFLLAVPGYGQDPPKTDKQTDLQEQVDELAKELKKVKETAESSKPGTTNVLLTGYGVAGFENKTKAISTFYGTFNPIFLWRLTDKVFFEGELELGLKQNTSGAGEAELELEYSHLTYLLHDYITIGAGLFLTPFGTFAERFHPDWINKLPDNPLPFGHDGLAPTNSLGFQFRGGIPAGSMKFHYSLWASNGPRLVTSGMDAGMLKFDNYVDINNSKAIGGRVGFLPIPELEVDFSAMYSRVSPDGTAMKDVNALLLSFDLGFVKEFDFGQIDARFQWVYSKVDDADYGGSVGSITDNKRNGGYVQVAYRPSKAENEIVKNFEFVVRFDWLTQNPDGAPEPEKEWRLMPGVDYWITPSTVVKLAYQYLSKTENPGTASEKTEKIHGVLAEFVIGF